MRGTSPHCCHKKEFLLKFAKDRQGWIDWLFEAKKRYGLVVLNYMATSNHIHLLLQAPGREELGRPMRWFMTETAKAFHRNRGRRGHFWERRYHACVVEDDTYALAALRYLDRNPVRAGLVDDPASYPWSSCAAYALGALDRAITFHPSYLALSPYVKVRQRQYRALIRPAADPVADERDPRWTTHRAVGSPAFVAQYVPRRPGRPRSTEVTTSNQQVTP